LRPLALGLGGLALLAFAMFFDALIAPGSRVVGQVQQDLALHFLWWREFGFAELAKGNLALWNPHLFSGAPFFGNTQAALLYPPNWLFLALPLPLATNCSIALNAWLLGAFMYLWASRRGLHAFAAFVGGALLMFCAPYFLHVPAGHLNILSALAWVPLLFLALDEWLASRRPIWCLAGMLAVAMQVLSGHPQYAYIAGLAAGGYALLRLMERRERPMAAAMGLLSFYVGGALLAAVQLLPGIQATAETVRSHPLPFEFAAAFNFPPENLVTFLAPGFFGDAVNQPYSGRWYLWEACAFIGVSGLALAAHGMSAPNVAGKRALLALAAAAALLALGDSTPLFRFLYDWLPMFDRFRGAGKFIFITALVLVLFAGYGLDRLLRERAVPARSLWTGGAIALALGIAALVIRAQAFASLGLLLAGLTLALVVGAALWLRREPRAAFLLGALAIAEVFTFARMQRTTFDIAQLMVPELGRYFAAQPGDYRILNLWNSNTAMATRSYDAWGYDPGVVRRYAEFIAWSEGADPDRATNYVAFRRFHRLLSMVRVKYVVAEQSGVLAIHPAAIAPLHRLELVGAYQVHRRRDDILRAMGDAAFDPRKEVILEQEPKPAPVPAGTQGSARVSREGTDFLEVEADLPAPSILLVTDAWARGWRAAPLAGSSQDRYELLPANYALRGIALAAGRHRLRLEYAPTALRAGIAISVLAGSAWIVALFAFLRRERGIRGA
jgi:hypothetical protein